MLRGNQIKYLFVQVALEIDNASDDNKYLNLYEANYAVQGIVSYIK